MALSQPKNSAEAGRKPLGTQFAAVKEAHFHKA